MTHPQRERVLPAPQSGFDIVLKRNCSISPAGLLRVFVLLALGSLGIAAGFALAGAWLILPFAGLEVLMLGAAFVINARHAADFERITVAPGRLDVEVGVGGHVARRVLDSSRARVSLERGYGSGAHVILRAPGRELEVGRHLHAKARVEFATELARGLRQ